MTDLRYRAEWDRKRWEPLQSLRNPPTISWWILHGGGYFFTFQASTPCGGALTLFPSKLKASRWGWWKFPYHWQKAKNRAKTL